MDRALTKARLDSYFYCLMHGHGSRRQIALWRPRLLAEDQDTDPLTVISDHSYFCANRGRASYGAARLGFIQTIGVFSGNVGYLAQLREDARLGFDRQLGHVSPVRLFCLAVIWQLDL